MPIRFIALIFLMFAGPLGADPRAVVLQTWTWENRPDGFSGVSGLELGPAGKQATFISDNGLVVTGHILRDATGIIGISATDMQSLTAPKGLKSSNGKRDAEGLVLTLTGEMFVSFEGPAHILRYEHQSGQDPRKLSSHDDFISYTGNSGLEALAIDAQGCLYTLPEYALDNQLLVYRTCQGVWQLIARLPQDGFFLPVGADIGPDGWLYLLERQFNGFGFRSRIRRVDLRFNAPLIETLFTSRTGAFDNLEGLAVWHDRDGRTRLSAISDDNYKWFQLTQIVEFVLLPPLVSGETLP